MKTKVLTIILILVFLLGGCTKQDSSKEEQTSSNKPERQESTISETKERFTSSNFKISFLAYSNWEIEENLDGKNINIKTEKYKKADNECAGDFGKIWITAIPNPKNLAIIDLYDTFNDTSRFWPKKFPYESFNPENNFEGIYFPLINDGTSVDCPSRSVVDLVDVENKRVISIHYFYTEDEDENIKEKYLELISGIDTK